MNWPCVRRSGTKWSTCAFSGAALLFWWPVIQPWPSRAQWPRWTMIPYLFLADFQNTALAAFLIFCDRVIYPSYAAAPRLLNLSPLEDQAAAGAVMWIPGSVVYLIPIGLLTIQSLEFAPRAVSPSKLRAELPIIQTIEALQLPIAPVAVKTWTSCPSRSSERRSAGRDFGGRLNRSCSRWRSSSLPMACSVIR